MTMRERVRLAWQLARQAPWHVRVVLVLSAAYLASPIDLIPDFIPVLGHLDDVLLLVVLHRYLVRQMPDLAGSLNQLFARPQTVCHVPRHRRVPIIMDYEIPERYVLGSLEQWAYSKGHEYADARDQERDEPLDGQWADEVWVADVLRDVFCAVFGPEYEPEEDDRDDADLILDIWEEGYHASFAERAAAAPTTPHQLSLGD